MPHIIPVSEADCQVKSWKILLKEAVCEPQQLLTKLNLTTAQLNYKVDYNNPFATRVPQPFIDKMQPGDPEDPLLRQVLAQTAENERVKNYSEDPLGETTNDSAGLLHKYHARVLLILASACAVNCRYCFRRHFPYQDKLASGKQLESAINYITQHTDISEVILSGGDPLIVSDCQLVELIRSIEKIPHVRRLRIHTRLPVVLPQRLTPELLSSLQKSRLHCSIVLHINHPNEIDPVLQQYLAPFCASEVTLLNQSVLLREVNDCLDTLVALSEKLFAAGILPYYLHQLDRVHGSAHFEVSDKLAIALVTQMRNRLPGYLVPRLSREETGAAAKQVIA